MKGKYMQVSFGSTYRIPITQPGVNKAKKQKLRALIDGYRGLISSGNTGAARISIANKDDANFEKELNNIGYHEYQRFDGENIPNSEIDSFIKEQLDSYKYTQRGKQKAKKPRKPYAD